jgi:uncharacterized RDD family membrane protein YckC
MLRGRTLGKLLMGLTIVNVDGSYVTPAGIIRRNLLGYALTVLTFGVGFLISAVSKSGRALHDLIAGTIVVRGRRSVEN